MRCPGCVRLGDAAEQTSRASTGAAEDRGRREESRGRTGRREESRGRSGRREESRGRTGRGSRRDHRRLGNRPGPGTPAGSRGTDTRCAPRPGSAERYSGGARFGPQGESDVGDPQQPRWRDRADRVNGTSGKR
ncbi:MAG: hypothetical protein CMJ59_06530 [Planctomycetaceae bacterium]|nr:hypothetical protein [Planctomycetaceae bacterium]